MRKEKTIIIWLCVLTGCVIGIMLHLCGLI